MSAPIRSIGQSVGRISKLIARQKYRITLAFAVTRSLPGTSKNSSRASDSHCERVLKYFQANNVRSRCDPSKIFAGASPARCHARPSARTRNTPAAGYIFIEIRSFTASFPHFWPSSVGWCVVSRLDRVAATRITVTGRNTPRQWGRSVRFGSATITVIVDARQRTAFDGLERGSIHPFFLGTGAV